MRKIFFGTQSSDSLNQIQVSEPNWRIWSCYKCSRFEVQIVIPT